MRQISYKFLSLLFTATALTSCDEQLEQTMPSSDRDITFSAHLIPAQTKAPILDDNGGGIFSDGDEITVIGAGYKEYLYTFSSADNTLHSDTPISWNTSLENGDGTHNFYAMYTDMNIPYANQAYDHLVASTIHQDETRHVALNFTHAMAKVKVELNLGEGVIWDERCRVLINGLNTRSEFSYVNGYLTAVPDKAAPLIEPILMEPNVNGRKVTMSAIVVAGGQNIKSIEIYAASNSSNGDTELRLYSYVPASGFIRSGYLSTVRLNLLSSEVLPVETTIEPWGNDGSNADIEEPIVQLITKATEPENFQIVCPGNMLWLSNQAKDGIENTNAYIVMNDIDMRCYPKWLPVGTESCPFKGSIDGQGYKFFGFSVKKQEGLISLFGYTDGASLHDINVTARFTNYGNSENSLTAGLVAVAKNTLIRNCNTNTTMTAQYIAGGIVAVSENSSIIDCHSYGSITSSITGGTAGRNSSGSIIACSNSAKVYSRRITPFNCVAGGIAGENNSYVVASRNSGKVYLSGSFNTFGDIVGSPVSDNSAIYSCWASSGTLSGGNGETGQITGSISTIESEITDYDVDVLNSAIVSYNDIVSGYADRICNYRWSLLNGSLTLSEYTEIP